jgi:flagellar basal-body rod protein FlgB
MFTNKVEVLQMARAMAAHAAARHGIIAANIANADTPGYRARHLPDFAQVWESQRLPMTATRPKHLSGGNRLTVSAVADSTHLSPNGNSVSLEAEMVAAAEARQAHDFALAIHRSLSGAIRATLGRR